MDKASSLVYEIQNLACIWILAFVSDDELNWLFIAVTSLVVEHRL